MDVRNQDNKKLWFKAKRYGYGWYPCTWQGWGVLTMYIFALFNTFLIADRHAHSVSDSLMNFFPQAYVLTAFLIIICDAKGEKAKWRWGNDKHSNE